MPETKQRHMAKSRALITDTEKDRISEAVDVEDAKKYQSVSRVRRRIREELPKEIELLAEHHPDLLSELRDTVCNGEVQEE